MQNKNCIKENVSVSYELLFIFFLNYFLSSELFLIIAIAYLMFIIFFRNNGRLIKNTKIHISYLVVLFVMGTLFGLINNLQQVGTHAIYRDMFYILNPISTILIGVYLQKTNSLKGKDLYKTIIVFSIIMAFISLFSLVHKVPSIQDVNSISAVRSGVDTVGMSVILSTLLLFTEKERGVRYFKFKIKILIILLFLVSIIASFSRTNLIILLILLLAFYVGKSNIKIKRKNLFFIIICLVIAWIFVPHELKEVFISKILRSLTEVSSAANWNSEANIVHNWRGYEMYCAKNEFLAGTYIQKLIGYGYGKGIYVGMNAYLVTGSGGDTIPVLHNGYYTSVIKNGILGFIVYISFYLNNIIGSIKKINLKVTEYDCRIYVGIMVSLMITTYFVMGIIYNSANMEICTLIGYIGNKIFSKNLKRM